MWTAHVSLWAESQLLHLSPSLQGSLPAASLLTLLHWPRWYLNYSRLCISFQNPNPFPPVEFLSPLLTPFYVLQHVLQWVNCLLHTVLSIPPALGIEDYDHTYSPNRSLILSGFVNGDGGDEPHFNRDVWLLSLTPSPRDLADTTERKNRFTVAPGFRGSLVIQVWQSSWLWKLVAETLHITVNQASRETGIGNRYDCPSLSLSEPPASKALICTAPQPSQISPIILRALNQKGLFHYNSSLQWREKERKGETLEEWPQ